LILLLYMVGWGTWIRTKTNRVRVCCATVTPFPKLSRNINEILDKLDVADQGSLVLSGDGTFYPLPPGFGKLEKPSIGGDIAPLRSACNAENSMKRGMWKATPDKSALESATTVMP
jgi:hypothetical protein